MGEKKKSSIIIVNICILVVITKSVIHDLIPIFWAHITWEKTKSAKYFSDSVNKSYVYLILLFTAN